MSNRKVSMAGAVLAVVLLAVAGNPLAAVASVTTYANYASAIEDQVFVSSTGTIGGNQGWVSGTLPSEWLTIRNTSSGTLVAQTSGGGATTVTLTIAPTSGLHDACWWNYRTAISGSLDELCKSSTTGTFAVTQATSADSAVSSGSVKSGYSSASNAAASSQSLPAAAASRLAAQGFHVEKASYLASVDSASVWSMTDSSNQQCVVEALSNGLAGADCASASVLEAQGLSLELGTSLQAPSKVYLLPKSAVLPGSQSGLTVQSDTPSGVLVTVAPGDDSAHTFESSKGKTVTLHQFGDWVDNVNHGNQ